LSSPSQTSDSDAPAVAVHTVASPRPVQTLVPEDWHIPSPTRQKSPRFAKLSSTLPLQSLSSPSQTSATPAPAVALHSTPSCAPLQTLFPEVWHVPVPTVQKAPRVAKLSSTLPSQSLSSPSHVSTGAGAPGVALHSVPSPIALQTILP